jgi:hypothetical protein
MKTAKAKDTGDRLRMALFLTVAPGVLALTVFIAWVLWPEYKTANQDSCVRLGGAGPGREDVAIRLFGILQISGARFHQQAV